MNAPATTLSNLYDAIELLPSGVTGELVNGQLYAHPRPSARHGFSTSNLGADLVNPFSRGRGGPGGWWIIDEPEVHLVLNQEVCVPDIGGWVRERTPSLPEDQRFAVVPDWVCEVLSPSTESFDRQIKMPQYAKYGVRFAWLIDPIAKVLEAYELRGVDWVALPVDWSRNNTTRIPPFDAIDLFAPWA